MTYCGRSVPGGSKSSTNSCGICRMVAKRIWLFVVYSAYLYPRRCVYVCSPLPPVACAWRTRERTCLPVIHNDQLKRLRERVLLQPRVCTRSWLFYFSRQRPGASPALTRNPYSAAYCAARSSKMESVFTDWQYRVVRFVQPHAGCVGSVLKNLKSTSWCLT